MKKVLITGANGGIGLALTKRFLEEDFFVFAHYHASAHNLESLDSENLFLIQGDFENLQNASKVFNSCIGNGSIDILVNNAGMFCICESISQISDKDFDTVLTVNLKAPFLLSKLVLEEMRKRQWGRIISISSIGVKFAGSAGSAAYTISKAALESMTLSFAKEGAPYNILANVVRVGVTNTKFHDLNPKKNMEKRIQSIPLKRWAEPEEIVDAVIFLASERSSFITGSILTVSGGE